MTGILSRRGLLCSSGGASIALLAGCKKSTPAVSLTIGDQKGGLQTLFEAAGQLSGLNYTLNWAQFGAAAPLFEAMNAGAIDAGIAGDAPFVFFLASNPPVQAVAALNFTNPAAVPAAIMVRANSGYTNIHDLVGRNVAVVRGSSGQYIVLAALKQANLPLDAVKFTYLAPSDGMTALLNNGVDAWGTWEPYVSIGRLHYGLTSIALPPGMLQGLGFLVATDQAISGKHDALADFLARFAKARDWVTNNQSTYAAAFAKDTGVPADVAAKYVFNNAFAVNAITPARVADVQSLTDLYAAAGLLPKTFPVAGAFNNHFLRA
jgi:sulfonate transport system substrate-binding protein